MQVQISLGILLQKMASPPLTTWTKSDYVNLILGSLIKFGDGVEIYLPGVITQKVSCELGVTGPQESILAVILYVFLAVSVITSIPLSKKFGERNVLLISLYMSILFAVLCALVPNYWTLLVSRALIGICVGLNMATVGVFTSKHASSEEVADATAFVTGSVALTIGSGWISILGWLLLDTIDWRNFVLVTSIPIFAPPILMLHCCATRARVTDEKHATSTPSTSQQSESAILLERKSSTGSSFAFKVIKASLFVSFNVYVGYGSIILLPSVIRGYKHVDENDTTFRAIRKCKEVVQGNDLLIIALVTGGANVIGRPLGYFLRKHISFRVLQSTLALANALSYGIMLFNPGLVLASVLMGVGKLSYSIQGAEASILPYDLSYFGSANFELGAGIVMSSAMAGSVLGTSLAAFLAPNAAVFATCIISVPQIVLICFMSERTQVE